MRNRPTRAVRWLLRALHRTALRTRIAQLQRAAALAKASTAMPAAELALYDARLAELRCQLYCLELQP